MGVWNLLLPSCYLVCSTSGENNGDKNLSRGPIWQSPQVSQCTQISGSRGLKFSLGHLSHQWAQRQDLICSQLTHRTEGLYSVNNQSTVRAPNNDDTQMHLVFPWALSSGGQWFLLSLSYKQMKPVIKENNRTVPRASLASGRTYHEVCSVTFCETQLVQLSKQQPQGVCDLWLKEDTI